MMISVKVMKKYQPVRVQSREQRNTDVPPSTTTQELNEPKQRCSRSNRLEESKLANQRASTDSPLCWPENGLVQSGDHENKDIRVKHSVGSNTPLTDIAHYNNNSHLLTT